MRTEVPPRGCPQMTRWAPQCQRYPLSPWTRNAGCPVPPIPSRNTDLSEGTPIHEPTVLGRASAELASSSWFQTLLVGITGWPGSSCGFPALGERGGGSPAWAAALAEFNRGAAHMEKYEYADAARAFNKVLESEPNWNAARFNRGLAYLNMAGANEPSQQLGPTKEMTDTAIATFEEVVAKDKDYYPAWYCLGILRAFLGKDDQWLECFAKVYSHDPDDPFVAYSYAKALRNVNRNGEAVPILEKIVQGDPGFVSAIHLLSTLYMKSGRWTKRSS